MEIKLSLFVTAFLHHVNAMLFGGKMTPAQESGVRVFLTMWVRRCNSGEFIPLPYLAYTLATVFHETARTMLPIEEYGKGRGYEYGIPDPVTGQVYYGRGYVQTTWDYNYKTLSTLIRDENGRLVDVYKNPELLLEPFYSAQATLYGMRDGIYTGRRLRDYLDSEEPDYFNARRVINGKDKAAMIAEYADAFHDAAALLMNRPVDRPLLKVGSANDYVRELQLYLGLKPDGQFGESTKKAVETFQAANNLKADGVAGSGTFRMLECVLGR